MSKRIDWLKGRMEWTLVRTFPKTCEDGFEVELYEMALPAVFYKIVAKPGPDSIGRMRKGWALGTGSGEKALAVRIANAIAGGMLDVEKPGAQ